MFNRMRWRRMVKRVLVALLFLCMTIKIHLELWMLDSNKSSGSFSPWWSNQTRVHLRAFAELTRSNEALEPISSGSGDAGEALQLTYSGSVALQRTYSGSEALQHTYSRSINILQNTSLNNATLPRNNLTVSRNNTINNIINRSLNLENISYSFANYKNISNAKFEILKQILKQVQQLVNNSLNGKYNGSAATLNNCSAVNESPSEENRNNVTVGARRGMAANMLIKRNIFAKLGIWDSKNKTKIDYVNTDFTEISSQHTNDRVSAHNEISDKEAGSVSSKPTSPSKNINAVKEKALPPTKNHVFKTPSIIAPNKGLSHEVDATEVSLAKDAIVMIKKQVALANEEQKVYNEERYGAVSSNTTILLVQVHNRLENLRYLVESMKKVRGIEETLVIFSHDFWDAAINDFVRNISTFRVMQIFFPFSIQLHPFSYPGRDPRDCSWNVPRVEEMQCLNHRWPDTYGHYREASFTQIKHHWWWKIHRVFEGVNVTRVNYTGTVVFLEEDHYLLPDLLHVLRLLQQHRASSCSGCQVLTLGNYNKLGLSVYRNFIERGDWWVTKHNLGFALDAAAWNTLSKCKKFFCTFDDYNWDWTLNNVVQTCASPRMSMLSARLTRVMHVGSCGTHVRKRSCDVKKDVKVAINRINAAKKWLFPMTLILQGTYRSSGRIKRGNGGWGDLRDRILCHAIGNGTASEHTIDALQHPERL
ncbi:uncharacterized protein [Cherax quadricarinatus]|uniref:uncharacterized protein isoform X2 n=1 Tax=Cherax quadricarinatus TaxID=27406 RepID=UPI00387E60E2